MSDIDKSLDDIISGRPRRGDRISKGGRGHDSRRRGGGRRGGGPSWRSERLPPRSRDMTDGPPPPDSRDRAAERPRGYTIMISNLYYGLNEDDLDSLFGRIGPIRNIKIQYDRSGRSEGYAWVTFGDYHHAREAIDQFDGKKAAGQVIGIVMATGYGFKPFEGNNFSRRLKNSPREDRRGRGTSRRGGSRGRGGAAEGASARRPKKTAEELDAELDAYMGGDIGGQPENEGSNKEEGQNEAGQEQKPGADIDMVFD